MTPFCFICDHINNTNNQTPTDSQLDSIIAKLTVDKSVVTGKLSVKGDNFIGRGSSANVFRFSVENWPNQENNPRCAEHSPAIVAFKVFHHVDDDAIKAELKTSLQGAAGCPHILAPLGFCRWENEDEEIKAAILLPCAQMSLSAVPPLKRTTATLVDVADRFDGLLSVCKAVQHLHNKRNIIHRDIKPQNIFVICPPGAKPQYKLGDLGASKQHAMSSSLITKTLTVGTVACMSPEQLLGQPATPASDIYSLALMLFESLSEESAIPEKFLDSPFTLQNGYKDGKIKIDPPTLPNCVSKLTPAFLQLATTIGNCFNPTPSKRPSADDLAAALTAARGVKDVAMAVTVSEMRQQQGSSPAAASSADTNNNVMMGSNPAIINLLSQIASATMDMSHRMENMESRMETRMDNLEKRVALMSAVLEGQNFSSPTLASLAAKRKWSMVKDMLTFRSIDIYSDDCQKVMIALATASRDDSDELDLQLEMARLILGLEFGQPGKPLQIDYVWKEVLSMGKHWTTHKKFVRMLIECKAPVTDKSAVLQSATQSTHFSDDQELKDYLEKQ